MRFYNPTPRQYESTLVDTRLPYDFLAGAIKGKQQEYDETLAKMQALGKEFGPVLPIDLQQAKAKEEEINTSVKDWLANIKPSNLEDPMFQRDLFKKQQELKEKAKIYEDVYKPRYEKVKQLQEDISKTKDLTQRKFLQNKLDIYSKPGGDQSMAANYNPLTKTYTPITPLDQFEWKDINKDLTEIGKTVETNTRDLGFSISSVDDFNKMLTEGKIESRDADKILGALYGYLKTPEVIKTAAAQRNVNFQDDFNTALEEEKEAVTFVKNKKGEIVPQINPNTLLGRQVNSVISARTTQKVDMNRKIFDDYYNRLKAKEDIQNPYLQPETIYTNKANNPNAPLNPVIKETKDLEAKGFKVEWSDKGLPKVLKPVGIPHTYTTATGEQRVNMDDVKFVEDKDAANSIVSKMVEIATRNPQISAKFKKGNTWDYKGINDYITAAYENAKTASNLMYTMPNVDYAKEDEQILQNYNQYMYLTPDGRKVGFEDYADALNVSAEQLGQAMIESANNKQRLLSNPSKGTLKGQVNLKTDSGTEQFEVNIIPSNEYLDTSTQSRYLNEKVEKMDFNESAYPFYKGFVHKLSITEDETGSPTLTQKVYNPNESYGRTKTDEVISAYAKKSGISESKAIEEMTKNGFVFNNKKELVKPEAVLDAEQIGKAETGSYIQQFKKKEHGEQKPLEVDYNNQ